MLSSTKNNISIPGSCGNGPGSLQRIYCDEMLKRLGRWLRAAGHDVLINEGNVTDREMLQQAIRDGRCLISRDKKLTEFKGAKDTVLILRSNKLSDCITELVQYMDINWLCRPFSRCMVCNAQLEKAAAEDWKRVPDTTIIYGDELWLCPGCQRLYWPGSHTRRMLKKLASWQKQTNAHWR